MRILKTVDLSQLCDLKSAFYYLWGLYDIVDDGNPPLLVRLVIGKLKVNAATYSTRKWWCVLWIEI